MSTKTKQTGRKSDQVLSDNEVNSYLRKRLKEANARNSEAIRRHVRGLRKALEREGDVIRPLFGGSFSKNTYVNGISDVDILMTINDSSLSGQPPNAVIRKMADMISQRMPHTKLRKGAMAVTVTYSDGYEIQVLPAIRAKSGIRIAERGSNKWSNVVNIKGFLLKLTEVNKANDRKVVPAIKLTKAMADQLVQRTEDKLSGYHIESLAIDAFEDYRGNTDSKSMVIHLAKFSAKAVLEPIKDSTGQSRYVDEYLGPPNSTKRKQAADTFKTMQKRLNGCKSTEDLDKLFGQ